MMRLNRKIKLLFVIESLTAAGAEKSLVSLLNEIDDEKYEVDLQLFSYDGTFQKFIPNEVNLLSNVLFFEFSNKKIIDNLFSSIGMKYLYMRFSYSIILRLLKLNNLQKARWLWNISKSLIKSNQKKKYDVAIAYAQGLPTYYVGNNVNAKKKVAWVNVSLNENHIDNGFQEQQYYNFNKIVIVSDASRKYFVDTFPSLVDKTLTIYDITSRKLNDNILSQFVDKNIINQKCLSILTIGRLAKQKGHQYAIDAALDLKSKGIDFIWYFLGSGGLFDELKSDVSIKGLSQNIIFLGVHDNPLAILKLVDIYVQPSLSEGFGLALFEARMIGKPCIATDFETASLQIEHNVNGQVVSKNATAISDAISRYINEPEFTKMIIENQKKCKFFNEEEYLKFDNIIDGFIFY